MNLQQAIEAYIINSQVEGKTRKTISGLEWDLNRFLMWKGDTPLEQVSAQDIRQYILYHQNRGLSAHSVHDVFKIVRAFFRWLIREELLERDPTRNMPAPKLPDILPKVLTEHQAEELLKYLKRNTTPLGRRNLVMLSLFLDSGLRASELTNLRMEDLNLEGSYLIVRKGKGQKDRTVPLSPIMRRYLWRWLAEWRGKLNPRDESVFVGKEGWGLQPVAVEHVCKRALAHIGVKGGPHLLRHSCATFYLRNGGDLERLRLLLGHADLSVIKRYVHLVPADLIKRHREISPLTILGQ